MGAVIGARMDAFRHLENLLTLRHKKTHQINDCEEAASGQKKQPSGKKQIISLR